MKRLVVLLTVMTLTQASRSPECSDLEIHRDDRSDRKWYGEISFSIESDPENITCGGPISWSLYHHQGNERTVSVQVKFNINVQKFRLQHVYLEKTNTDSEEFNYDFKNDVTVTEYPSNIFLLESLEFFQLEGKTMTINFYYKTERGQPTTTHSPLGMEVDSEMDDWQASTSIPSESQIEGRDTADLKVPLSLAAVYRRSTKGLEFVCGGALVSPNHVITAAHCLTDKKTAHGLVVMMGWHHRPEMTDNTRTWTVRDVVLHPNYTHTRTSDVAVLVLTRSANNVRPVSLYTENMEAPSEGTVVTWGVTDNNNLTDVAKHVKLPIASDEKCSLTELETEGDATFCVGTKSAHCLGDRGSVMFMETISQNGSLQQTLGGIASGLPELESPSCHSYLAFTDVASVAPWLKQIFQEFDEAERAEGTDVEADVVPWLVAVYRRTSSGLEFSCSGALVSHLHVVTAAHCVNVPTHELALYVGRHQLDTWGAVSQSRVVTDVHRFSSHNHFTPQENDVALLELESPVIFNHRVQPLKIADLLEDGGLGDDEGYTDAVVLGWLSSDESISDRPKLLDVTIATDLRCTPQQEDDYDPYDDVIESETVCVKFKRGSGVCSGDRGAAMYSRTEEGRWVLRGIVSGSQFATKDTCSKYSTFSKMAAVWPWVNNITNSQAESLQAAHAPPFKHEALFDAQEARWSKEVEDYLRSREPVTLDLHPRTESIEVQDLRSRLNALQLELEELQNHYETHQNNSTSSTTMKYTPQTIRSSDICVCPRPCTPVPCIGCPLTTLAPPDDPDTTLAYQEIEPPTTLLPRHETNPPFFTSTSHIRRTTHSPPTTNSFTTSLPLPDDHVPQRTPTPSFDPDIPGITTTNLPLSPPSNLKCPCKNNITSVTNLTTDSSSCHCTPVNILLPELPNTPPLCSCTPVNTPTPMNELSNTPSHNPTIHCKNRTKTGTNQTPTTHHSDPHCICINSTNTEGDIHDQNVTTNYQPTNTGKTNTGSKNANTTITITTNYTNVHTTKTVITNLNITGPPEKHLNPTGEYCSKVHQVTCKGRNDNCKVPIGTHFCYCDEFCNSTLREHYPIQDCCPDYYEYVLDHNTDFHTAGNIIMVFSQNECIHEEEKLKENQTIQVNCNKCTCSRSSRDNSLVLECDPEECLVDPEVVRSVNLNSELGWSAHKYPEFLGRTLHEGVKHRLGAIVSKKFLVSKNPLEWIVHPLPASFDARSKWPLWVSDIEDQGWCGSSWALSTGQVVSDRFAIVSRGAEKVRLSVQQLLDCVYRNKRQFRTCEGGEPIVAWSYFGKQGVVEEHCYPYERRSGAGCPFPRNVRSLQALKCASSSQLVQRNETFRTCPTYPLRSEREIMADIVKSGPVQATMEVPRDFFLYQSGVYQPSLKSEHSRGHHSVRIVGWGQEGQVKYWVVANSWGRWWGEDGYFRILRGQNTCQIEGHVLAAWPVTVHTNPLPYKK